MLILRLRRVDADDVNEANVDADDVNEANRSLFDFIVMEEHSSKAVGFLY